MKKKCKNKLNIAMIGHKRIPSREGGVEVVVEELATRMVKKGYSVTCYNRGGHHVSGKEYDNDLKHDEYKGVKIKKIPVVNLKGVAAAISSVVASFIVAFGEYDVVHFHAEGPSLLCWLPKLFGKKIVVTIHGLDHQRAKWGKLGKCYILLGEKSAVKYADEIIVLSESVKRYFSDKYNRDTEFIPNGVSKPKKRKANIIKEKWNLSNESYILFLGRIVPEKGIAYLIKAYSSLNTDKKLVIAGGVSDTSEYGTMLKKMAIGNNNILFTGFVQGEILEELYSNAYIYVLPSDLEGMPLSLLEAMSYGNCCLTSDIPECTEVIENVGMTFERGNVLDLANKMQKLCDQQEYVHKIKNMATDFVCAKYNWDIVVDRTLELYKKSED